MLSLIPHSVSRARAGFVRNPAAGWSINTPQWVLPPKKVDMVKVDRVVAILERFVARWVTQSRDARRAYAAREAGARWTREAWTPAWSNVMEVEDARARIARRREFVRLIQMPEADWHAHCRAEIAAATNIGPLVEAWQPINAARAQYLIQTAQVWNEVVLHNRQQAAGVRVARVVRNHFDTGSDSE
jgi:hypothetical protein